MEKKTIIIAKDFSEYPGPRYIQQGESSGEEFYVKLLNPTFAECLKTSQMLELNLDSSAGYATSFLDEALGELVFDFTEKSVRENLIIKSDEEPEWVGFMESETYPQWEKRRKEDKKPQSTTTHKVFYLDLSDNIVKERER